MTAMDGIIFQTGTGSARRGIGRVTYSWALDFYVVAGGTVSCWNSVASENYGGSAAVAGARGKFSSMQFPGIDGVQGPYRLRGADNENEFCRQ